MKKIKDKSLIFLSVILLILLGFQLFSPRQIQSADTHFMTQINALRTGNGKNPIARNPYVDTLAYYIHAGYYDYFALLDKMDTLNLSEQGQYPVYWNLHVNSSVAEQINSMSEFEQGFFVNPDVLYWGHYIDRNTHEYVLVLIFANPLFQELDVAE